jgi:uncharacterized protein
MPIVLIAALFLVAATTAFSALVGWKVSSMILFPKIDPYDTVTQEEIQRGSFTREWFDHNVRLEEFFLRSPFGYDLHCALWPRGETASFSDGRRRVAVLAHGFTYCLLGGIKYAAIFRGLGFDCILYDHRNHGLSGKAPTTMGACESRDLALVCAWARGRFGEDALLGTHGESMGAATVMLHAALDDRLAFAVADCGFSDWTSELRFVMRSRFHLPAYPGLWFASLFSRLRGGVFFRGVSPKKALRKAGRVPMLFVHGDADELVPFSMLAENFDAKAGVRAALAFPGGTHAGCCLSDNARYRDGMTRFLKENGVL